MKQLFKVKLGFVAVITGVVGVGFGIGGVENSMTAVDMISSIGVAVTSLMLMQVGVWLVKEEI